MPFVYKYKDLLDNKVKYVGIVVDGKLNKRIYQHTRDEWYKTSSWEISYIPCESRSEAEAIESHLISVYGTGDYFNIAKKNWGKNKYLNDVKFDWEVFDTDSINNSFTCFQIPDYIIYKHPHLSSNAKLLYGLLYSKFSDQNCKKVDQIGNSYISFSNNLLASMLSLTKNTIISCFKELENEKLIKRIQIDVGKSSNIYLINEALGNDLSNEQ